MTDFPEKVWVSPRTSTVMMNESAVYMCRSQEFRNSSRYIRADLYGWRPINDLDTHDRVILLYDNDHITSGTLDSSSERRFIRTNVGRQEIVRFTHFMPIPEIPK